MATDWKDLIPVRGEAEVSAKLKGAYGGKMSNRSRLRGGFRRKSTNRYSTAMEGAAELEWTQLDGANFGLGSASGGQRLFYFNADTPAVHGEDANEGDARSVSRLLVQFEHRAVPKYWVDGTVSHTYSRTGSTGGFGKIPMLGGTNLGGYQGVNPVDTAGGSSAASGGSLWLMWIYETQEEAEATTDLSGFVTYKHYQQNRRIFRQEMIPVRMQLGIQKYDIKLPNVRLSHGARETYQVSLVGACGFPDSNEGHEDTMDVRGWGKAFYQAK